MADSLVGATLKVLLERLLFLATENIGLVLGFKEEAETLRGAVEMIQAFLVDSEEKQLKQRAVKLWLMNLEGVAYEAGSLFDELKYEILRSKVQTQKDPMKGKVCFFSSFSNSKIAFRWRIASKIRGINIKMEKINDEANSFELQSQLGASSANTINSSGPVASRETNSSVDRNAVGGANDASKVVELLLSLSAEVVSFLGIMGMGGLGKRTFGLFTYNEAQIEKHFDIEIWIYYTMLFKLILIRNKVDLIERDTIVSNIEIKLEGKRYLHVSLAFYAL